MKVYVVVIEFQGLVNDVMVYKNEFKALNKIEKLKKEHIRDIETEKMSVSMFECDLE
ncbi:MAG: hypothetical protein ACE5K4_10980 [Candidatus Hydrothermarchaeota archaeon]